MSRIGTAYRELMAALVNERPPDKLADLCEALALAWLENPAESMPLDQMYRSLDKAQEWLLVAATYRQAGRALK